jgi:response regulator RpfG family c-di-GMP phosphodiesterase
VLTHHERCDGKGYPNGITFGEQATGMDLQEVSTDFARMASWILPVSDTYDAMTSPRPYRDALPTQTALDELNRCKGGQFVPEVVEAFLKFYQKNKEKFIPVKSIIDYTKYPVLLLGENREQLQTIKDVLGKNFTIEIASDIESAKEMLARDNTIRLTLVVQQISGMIDQEMISELLANRFPLTKIALKFAEAHSDWDELINQFQVIKHTFNSASPQILKAEIRKGIEEAMLKEGQEDAATRATQ